MQLSDLNPTLSGDMGNGVVEFDCPGHADVRITIPFRHQTAGDVDGVHYWQATGSFPDTLTLIPSIRMSYRDVDGKDVDELWHGFITKGEVIDA